ncbi:MAG: trigger factor [Cephaloticoccus sp.]|nr:trigger factor [Cephaloticoccus sp.]MCF7759429.1 trigger factor [Cephaloticoccus sp.]
MNVQLNSISDTRKSLVVSLDKSEVDTEHQAVVGEFTKQARLPGFRPGKAPAAMITKRFGKEITEEFKQKVVAKAYREGLEQQKLDVLTIVKVEPGTIEPGISAAVTVTVDVRPEFEMPEYVGIKTEVASTEVNDEEVLAAIEAMRGERAEFKVAEREAHKSDYVKLAYEGTIEGKPITELVPDKQIYGKVPQTWEEVEGEHEGVIPGLGKQLSGLKPGDKKEIEIEFPAEYAAAPALAGKKATYAVEIQEIRERVLPELDEAFFKANQADDLPGLKTSVSNNLKLQKESRNRAEQRRQITDALLAKMEFSAPESLVESETQSVLRQFIEENMRRGMPQDQFEKDKKELIESARKAATGRVKLQLVLAKIAEAEKIQVDEKDINTFIYRESMRTSQPPDKMVKELSKNRDALRSVQQSIIFDKAVDFLVSKATVTTTQPQA